MEVMRKLLVISISCLLLLAACSKNEDVVFGVNDVNLYQNSGQKDNQKSAAEFISIAYADIFQTTVTSNVLERLSIPYVAFGDNKLIEDVIIRNMLNNPNAILPTDPQMRADVANFIEETYQRFYNRNPDAFEAWQMEEFIMQDPDLTVELIYYAFMTSEEYRYY